MLLPIRDISAHRVRAPATVALVALSVLAFAMQLGNGLTATVWKAGVIPWELTHAEAIELPSRLHPLLTPLASMFLHGGLIHLAGNMLYLWVFGPNVEKAFGRTRFVLLYLGAGVAGMLAHAFSTPHSVLPAVGASGAVAGILGAHLLLYPRGRVRALLFLVIFLSIVDVPSLLLIGVWAALQAAAGFTGATGSIAVFAHLAGFVVGCVAARHRRPPS
ncbi:MAG: rhomboid family intramembrane serine protease [Candidatus Eisenbacteria bacterium]|nr:rhomboid family intramembrane serine protease [Candidatus Eisenbacteria bacterium]